MARDVLVDVVDQEAIVAIAVTVVTVVMVDTVVATRVKARKAVVRLGSSSPASEVDSDVVVVHLHLLLRQGIAGSAEPSSKTVSPSNKVNCLTPLALGASLVCMKSSRLADQ